MPFITINGATIEYREKGPADAPAILLLHGFPLSHKMWDEQVDALAGPNRTIVVDFRGFGNSAPAGPFTIESLADDVHAFAEALHIRPFVLGGLSMGGYVALAYAKKYPADLKGLMLFDTRADADTEPQREGRGKMIDTALKQGAFPISEAMLAKLIPETSAKARPHLVRELRQMMESTNPQTIAHALAAMRDRPDLTGAVGAIGVPTLIVCGEMDIITPVEVMKALHDLIPGSTFRTIPGSGHMTPMEQPQLVNQAIEAFLEGGQRPVNGAF